MDGRQALVSAIHFVLASTVAIIALIGLFGTRGDEGAGTVVIGFQLSLFVVLPMIGIVALGLADWQVGRGTTMLRAADIATFVLAALDLSLGATGLARWLAGGRGAAARVGRGGPHPAL